MHLLDMAIRYYNKDLIRALVAKVLEVFRHLELGQVYMKRSTLVNFSLVFLNLCVSTHCDMNFKRVYCLFQLCCAF